MAKSFKDSSHKILATKKLNAFRKAEDIDARGDPSPLITLLWEEAMSRDSHGIAYLPDKDFTHYQRYFWHMRGMSIGGYSEHDAK